MKYFGIVLLVIAGIGMQQNFATSQTPCCNKTKVGCDNSCCESQGCKSCRLHVETLKVKKSCFYVECKEICIPPVRFPWQKCCELKCGKVKTVRVLKKHDYTCEKCGYKWTVDDLCGACTTGKCETTAPKPVQSAQKQIPLAPAISGQKR